MGEGRWQEADLWPRQEGKRHEKGPRSSRRRRASVSQAHTARHAPWGAGFQQDGAGPAEEEQKRGVLPQSCEQSVQAELQQGVRQRQQADDDRLAQEAEGGEGMVMPLSGHGASSARM